MLSVVVPVYNEALTIQKTVRLLNEQPLVKEIIVVDDGSTDGTRNLVTSLTLPKLKVLLHETNKGKGAAIITGLNAVTQPYMVVHDADLEYAPDDLERLIKPLEDNQADVVMGSRFLGARRIFLFWHYVGNKLLTLCANLMYNTNMTDLMTCYKMMPTRIWSDLGLRSHGFEIEAEIAAKIFKCKLRVFEIPISYSGRGYEEGKKTTWKTGFRTLFAVFKYRFWTRSIGEETLYRIAKMKRFNWLLYQYMRPYIGKRIIEAGCGMGTFTRFFPNAEKYIGIDRESRFIEKLRDTYDAFPQFEFSCADLEHMDIQSLACQRLDTVISINVLEHLSDDRGVLKAMYDMLEPGGTLILLVPAMPALYSNLDKELGHVRRYKYDELKQKITDTGFNIVRQHYFNSFGVLGWWLNGKVLGRRLLPHKQLNVYEHLTPLFFSIERRMKIPFGLSIFLVAKK